MLKLCQTEITDMTDRFRISPEKYTFETNHYDVECPFQKLPTTLAAATYNGNRGTTSEGPLKLSQDCTSESDLAPGLAPVETSPTPEQVAAASPGPVLCHKKTKFPNSAN